MVWEFEKDEELEDFRKAMRKKSLITHFCCYTVKNKLRISISWNDETEAIFELSKEVK